MRSAVIVGFPLAPFALLSTSISPSAIAYLFARSLQVYTSVPLVLPSPHAILSEEASDLIMNISSAVPSPEEPSSRSPPPPAVLNDCHGDVLSVVGDVGVAGPRCYTDDEIGPTSELQQLTRLNTVMDVRYIPSAIMGIDISATSATSCVAAVATIAGLCAYMS